MVNENRNSDRNVTNVEYESLVDKLEELMRLKSSNKEELDKKVIEYKNQLRVIVTHVRFFNEDVDNWKPMKENLEKLEKVVEQIFQLNGHQTKYVDDLVVVMKNILDKMKQLETQTIQHQVKINELEAFKTRITILSTYRDWVVAFKTVLVEKINADDNNDQILEDWCELEKKLKKERYLKASEKKITKLLKSTLQDFSMTEKDFDKLSDLKNESNFTFHNNNQSIEDAKKYLNEVVFPEDMTTLKVPLKKALDAVEAWRKECPNHYEEDEEDEEE